MKKKIEITDLKVKSFVTGIEKPTSETIRAGYGGSGGNGKAWPSAQCTGVFPFC